MLTAEQYNKYIKSLSKANKSIEEGLARGYGSRFHILQQQLTKNPSLIDPPAYMLPGSHIKLPSRAAADRVQVTIPYQTDYFFYLFDTYCIILVISSINQIIDHDSPLFICFVIQVGAGCLRNRMEELWSLYYPPFATAKAVLRSISFFSCLLVMV
jgi:hypothetical protein